MGLNHFIRFFPFNPLDLYRAFFKYSPYNIKEIFGCYIRNSFGPSYKNKDIVETIPQSATLNDNVIPRHRIAFIGDIMDMAGKNEIISENVKQFIDDCDYLVGNFEATITTEKKSYNLAQRHTSQIIDALADLFVPDRTFLGLSNNHAGDFASDIFAESVSILESNGFIVFGTANRPFVDIGSNVRIVAATTISNSDCEYIVKLEDAIQLYASDKFNLLYPHWGYDLELFPRPETIALAQELIQDFDAIIGHHAHVPQPVTVVNCEKDTNAVNRLIAYGLGDFCIWEELEHYLYGMVIKLEIGSTASKSMKIGQVEWRYTKCQQINETDWETKIVDKFPYL